MTEAAPRTTEPAPTFSPIVVLGMILAGVFSFSAFIVLSGFAPDLRSGSDGGAHALSRSAVGYAGMVRLLKAEGVPVLITRHPDTDPIATWREIILTPGVEVGKDQFAALGKFYPIVVVLPKWLATPSSRRAGWVDKAGVIPPLVIAKMLQPVLPGQIIRQRPDTSPLQLIDRGHILAAPITGPIDRLQTLAPSDALVPIETDSRGGVVVAMTKDKHVTIVSDPDLLNTQGIANVATARVGADILTNLQPGDGPIAFDVSLNGFGSPPSLFKLAFTPPYLGASLCLFAAGLLMGLHAATRFGAPLRAARAIDYGKRALADNSAALIRMARREHRMATRYLDLNRAAVVSALGITRLAEGDLDVFLDRLAENSGVAQRLSALVPQARAAANRRDLMQLARNVYEWRVEMTRERR
jgi:hypothetical protein